MTKRDYGQGSITPRGKRKWLIRLRLGIDPITGTRRRLNRTVTGTKRDAQQALDEARQQHGAGLAIDVKSQTVAQFLRGWVDAQHRHGGINARSHERYEGVIERHLIPTIGHLALPDLRYDHVAALRDSWVSGEGSTAAHPLSAASIHKHLHILRKAMREAVARRLIPFNPVEGVTAPRQAAQPKDRVLDDGEIRRLLAAGAGTRFASVIRIALATGARQGELLSLRWEDVDWDRSLVHVAGTKSAQAQRDVELSSVTLASLRRHRLELSELRLATGPVWQDHGLVFPSRIGTPWVRRAFYRGYLAVVDRAGLAGTGVDFHCLRHTATTHWIFAGQDRYTIAKRLGHKDSYFTERRYGGLLLGQQRVAAQALDHLLA
ncbi:MAG: site-specific integrase [Chloroflexi bacterium]|nr:site-specific integrase [Chloroflexota bacterium]